MGPTKKLNKESPHLIIYYIINGYEYQIHLHPKKQADTVQAPGII